MGHLIDENEIHIAIVTYYIQIIEKLGVTECRDSRMGKGIAEWGKSN